MKIRYIAFLSLFCFFNHSVSAEDKNLKQKPLWEIGIGAGGLHQNYYTGTKQTRSFLFPVPAPIYRGEILKSDDKGMRAELFESDKYKLDMSLDFNLAIDSEDVDLRKGMPDIPNNFQIGPSLEYTIDKTANREWLLNFPLRANIGMNTSGIGVDGFTFSPNISYLKDFYFQKNKWRFGFAFGPQFGSSDYHNVYYGVADKYANSWRNAYDADSGYTGNRTLLTLSSKNDKRLLVLFLRNENIRNAAFEDSPLVETNNNLIAGFIYSHYLFKSKTMVASK